MFATSDIIQNIKPTEPRFFKLIRLGHVAIFLIGLGYYAYLQSELFLNGLNKPNVSISQLRTNLKINFPGFTICPHNPNTTQYLDDPESEAKINLGKRSPQEATPTPPTENVPSLPAYSFNVTCEFHKNVYGPGILTGALDASTTDESLDCNTFLKKSLGCYQFRPTEYFSEYNNNDPSLVYENYTVFKIQNLNLMTQYFALFLDYYNDNGDSYKFSSRSPPDQPRLKQPRAIMYNWHSIDTTKTTYFEYAISILQTYSTPYLGQCGITPDVNSLKFEVEKNLLPPFRNDEIVFIIKPRQPYQIRYEAEVYPNYPGNMISKLGGFFSAISGMFYLLFGSPRLAPWGIFQRFCLRCWPCRRSFKRHLAARYVSSAGIPFGEYVEDRPEGSSVERRLQILETLLKEYYIDSYYLETLRETKIRYQMQKEKYDRLEKSETETLIVNDNENTFYDRNELSEIKIDE